MLMDFGIMSILLVAAHLVRSRVRLLQDFFVPTPILAGFIGLFLGEQFLDVLPFSASQSGDCAISRYPSLLVVLVFATLFMGHRKKRPSIGAVLRSAGDTALFWFVGRRIYHNFWLERSIFAFGWNTGVVAIGIALLRVVDPRLRTKTLEDFGLGYALLVSVEIPLLVIVPVLALKGVILAPALVLIAISLGCVVASACLVGWFRAPAGAFREGEVETIAEDESGRGEPGCREPEAQ